MALLDCVTQEFQFLDAAQTMLWDDLGLPCYQHACALLVEQGYLQYICRPCYLITAKGEAALRPETAS